jgi:phage shock protein A
MSAEPAPRALLDAGARRTLDAERRVRTALRELDSEGATITFAAVANRARVSRVFLYQHAELRTEIETLRAAQTTAPARVPVRQRASDASLRTRLRAALDESQRQREENARLREELALAHGRVRELELDRRAGRR